MRKVIKPVFIVGMGRSGTTILGRILSMHRDVGFLNEPKALWHAIYPGEDVVGSYSRESATFRLNSEDATSHICKTAHRLVGCYLFLTRSQRLVDKYPELIFRIPFIKAIYPDARFLLLVRNGWDVCHSVAEWQAQHGTDTETGRHDWWGVDDRKWNLLIEQVVRPTHEFDAIRDVLPNLTKTFDRAAVEWMATMKEGVRMIHEWPADIYQVRYEDLIGTPQKTLPEILNFCNLAYDETMVYYAVRTLTIKAQRNQCHLHGTLRPLFNKVLTEMGYGRDVK